MIEDCDGLKYVGSTTRPLNERLSGHKSHKKTGKNISSSKLNLDNCIITQLEQCNLEHKKERERFWINGLDCVNQLKLNFDKEYNKEYHKEWYEKNKEKKKEYREKNKEKQKHYHKNKYIDRVVKECMDDMINQLLL